MKRAVIFSVLLSILPNAHAESLIPERDWTNSEGKTIRAELTEFVAGVAQFRADDGRRFPIADDLLSQRDQAAVFAARMFDSLNAQKSSTSGTEFFYSTHIPANQRSSLFQGYISFGDGRFSLELFVPATPMDFRGWETVTFTSSDYQHVYKIGKSDPTVSGEGNELTSRVRMFFRPNRDEPLITTILEGLDDNSLTIIMKKGEQTHQIRLNEQEENGLRDLLPLFGQACKLIRAGALQREILSDQLEAFKRPGGMEKGTDTSPPNEEALQPFREQLAREKYGSLTWTPSGAEAQTGNGLGWLGADIVIRTADDEVRRVPHQEIDKAALQRIYEARIDESFDGKSPPSGGGTFQYIWPEWSDHDRQYRQCLLFAVHSGRPYLVQNVWTTRFDGQSMTDAIINSDGLESPITVSASPKETRQNPSGDRIYSIVYNFLNPDEAEKLFPIANATSVSMRLNSGKNTTTLNLNEEEELFVTREGVALYQWHLALER